MVFQFNFSNVLNSNGNETSKDYACKDVDIFGQEIRNINVYAKGDYALIN